MTVDRRSVRDLGRIVLLVVVCSVALGGGGATSLRGPGSAPQAPTPGDETSPIAVADVTEEAGLGAFRHETGAVGNKWFPETMGAGGGFIDYNGDGYLDILLVGGGTWEEQPDPPGHHALWLYRNDGDGTFTLRTEEAGLGDVEAYGFGVTVADYDNNGHPDFYLTTLNENKLFRNDGGTFTEVGTTAGVAGAPVWSSSAVFFDANRDGHLDLYVGNYVKWSPKNDFFCSLDGDEKVYCTPEDYEGIAGRFYRNDGDGTFTDATEEVGMDSTVPGKTLGVVELDCDQDGWPDLAVANDMERNLLFHNEGDGTFTEVGTRSGIAYDRLGRPRAGMGIDAGVVDTTGEVTLFVSNFSGQMVSVFRHVQAGLFEDRADLSMIGRSSQATLGFGLFLFDVNLDGHLDLFVANGHVQREIEDFRDGVEYRQPPQLFINQAGTGTFDEYDPTSGVLNTPLVGRGAAYGDVNQDGKLDVLVTENGGPAHLWRNDSNTRHFLRVGLRGTESNRDGIGARVVAVAGEHNMERRVRAGSSYMSQNEKIVTFGLGRAVQVDSLSVYWPSGHVDRFENLEADQTVRIVEGAATPDIVAEAPPVTAQRVP